MHFLDILLNLVFPTRCISCQKSGADLCRECLCACPPAERPTEEWIFPLFDYRDIAIKKSIWFLKYKGRKKLAKVFAEVLYGRIIEELSDLRTMKNFHDALLIPIPLSNKRKRERGYNQTELICEELEKIDKENVQKNFELEKNILQKTTETEHQARIKDRESRLKNLTGSFTIKNPETIKNRNVILIDDVTTTGATLREAKKILKQSGAKQIIAFIVAH